MKKIVNKTKSGANTTAVKRVTEDKAFQALVKTSDEQKRKKVSEDNELLKNFLIQEEKKSTQKRGNKKR